MHDEFVYREHQAGWLLILALAGASLLVLAVGPAAPAWPRWLAIGSMLLGALALGRLTVEVGGGELRWRYGWLGLPRWRVPLAAIERIEPCRTHDVAGWGIHRTKEGWLYNIAGHDALRVVCRDGRRFRVGSADVAGLRRVLEPRLSR